MSHHTGLENLYLVIKQKIQPEVFEAEVIFRDFPLSDTLRFSHYLSKANINPLKPELY